MRLQIGRARGEGTYIHKHYRHTLFGTSDSAIARQNLFGHFRANVQT